MRLVKVTWLDHASFALNQWQSLDGLRELRPQLVESVGWLVHETRDFVTLVSTVGENEGMTGEICIGRGMIRRIEAMGCGKKKGGRKK